MKLPPNKLNDAEVLAPFSLDDPRYAQDMIVSIGKNRDSMRWQPKSMPISTFVDLLSRHREDKNKDGLGFVLAEIVGNQRKKAAVAKCYGVGLDIDVGVAGAVIDAALVKLGKLAVRYTTHSHGKSTTKVLKDRIAKWCKKNEIAEGVTQASIIRFLREESRWDESIIETVEYVDDVHDPEGFMVQLDHIPMPKHRVVLPLTEPFVPTAVASTHDEGMKMWGDVCRALATALGDLPLDRSAVDPSRLFYFPRHVAARPFEIRIIGGDLLDWKSLDLSAISGAGAVLPSTGHRPKPKSTTQEGRTLGRWSIENAAGFQIVDVIKDHAEERIRTPGAHKIDIECPFDEEHSDPGNPQDKGCFAVNAGDGPSPVFTIKCQHDSCSTRTNLDMLGKMLSDGWFGDDVLSDDAYNPLVSDDAEPSAAAKAGGLSAPGVTSGDPYDDLMAEVASLTADADYRDTDRIIGLTLKLTSPTQISKIKSALKKCAGLNFGDFDRIRKQAQRSSRPLTDEARNYRVDSQGVTLFEYFGTPNEFDQIDAVAALADVMLSLNDDDGGRYPMLTYGPQGVTKMDRTTDGEVIFTGLSGPQLRGAANTRIALVRIDENGMSGPRKHLPVDITSTFYETAHRHLPATPEILRAPTFMEDGSLRTQDGWDESRSIYMETAGFKVPEVPETPAAALVESSLSVLRNEMLSGFPFLAFDTQGNERREPAEAAAIAMIITPFMRRMIHGSTPLFFVSKPTPGTGGTLLGGVPARVYEGRAPVPIGHSEHNEAENRKELLSAVNDGRNVLFYDDVRNFNSRVIIQALTSPVIAGRRLGGNDLIETPNNQLWIATGNNPDLQAEMRRRTVEIRLNARTDDIQSIKHERDLPTWIPENRTRIVHATLVLVQHWIAQGQPLFSLRSLAGFENWTKTVGGVLMSAGLPDLLDVMRPAETDYAMASDRKFVQAWLVKFGIDQVTTVPALVDFAISIDAEVIEGTHDIERRKRMPGRLATMVGVTYKLGDKGKPHRVTVVQTADDDGNLAYKLAPVEHNAETEVKTESVADV